MDPSKLNTILHDLFVVGLGAASIFVKNPASQQHASTIISILSALLPHAEEATPGAGTTTTTAMQETSPMVD